MDRKQETLEFADSIKPEYQPKLIQALRLVIGHTPARDDLVSYIDGITDIRQWGICMQMDNMKLVKLDPLVIAALIRRYEPSSSDLDRSRWRRLCAKHHVSTKPLGLMKDKPAYNRMLYILGSRGRGKRLNILFNLYDDMTEFIKSEHDPKRKARLIQMKANLSLTLKNRPIRK